MEIGESHREKKNNTEMWKFPLLPRKLLLLSRRLQLLPCKLPSTSINTNNNKKLVEASGKCWWK